MFILWYYLVHLVLFALFCERVLMQTESDSYHDFYLNMPNFSRLKNLPANAVGFF